MNKIEKTGIFYYHSEILNLKISASNEAVTDIDFVSSAVHRSKELSSVVKSLFSWLDDYSLKKTDSGYKIIMLGGRGRGNGLSQPAFPKGRDIFIDTSECSDSVLRVYRELIKTVPGETISYGRLAEKCGFAGGARFIGNVMAANSFPVLVPCHRVVRADGSIGNYSGGVEVKGLLLEHESEGFNPVRI